MPETITCQVCGEEFRMLTNTHLAKHDLTPSEYESVYGEPTRTEESNSKVASAIEGIERETVPAENRFWEKVDKTGSDDCWEWKGAKDTNGYGNFYLEEGCWTGAHRYSLCLSENKQPMKEELYVCHHCDNPSCVNPDHLFWGRQKDNIEDMYVKGRNNDKGPKGESNWHSKLSEEQVQEIKDLLDKGNLTQEEISELFSVDQTTISSIKREESWSHLESSG